MVADPLAAFRSILDGAHRARPEDLPALAMHAAGLLGAREIAIYLVDYGQQNLVPLAGPGAARRDPVRGDGTVCDRAGALPDTHEFHAGGGPRLWIPLLGGTRRFGVLEVVGRAAPAYADYH